MVWLFQYGRYEEFSGIFHVPNGDLKQSSTTLNQFAANNTDLDFHRHHFSICHHFIIILHRIGT